MNIEEVVGRFEEVKKTSNGYKVRCPSHDDKHPSLDISQKDGKILMHCHAGCDTGGILEKVGLEMKDLYPENRNPSNKAKDKKENKKAVCAYYEYFDEDGKLLYRKVKYEPKEFSIQRFENGKWISGIKGIKRVLYNLPEVMEGVKNGQPIYIVEGEKDVETLKKYKKIATCPAFGAGKNKWDKDYNTIFKNSNVIIIQDNDNIGKDFAKTIAMFLSDTAKSVKLIDLSLVWNDMPKNGDVSDFLERYDIDKLDELINNTDIYKNIDIFSGTDYFWDDGSFYVKREGGNKYLGNFFLRVNKEIIKDDGTNIEKFYELQPVTDRGELESRLISAKNLNNLNFTVEQWGLILRPAIIYNIDKFHIDSLRAQYKNVPCTTIYSHTGWKKINGNWFFLYSGGAINESGTNNDINVELDQKLSGYCLDIPNDFSFNIDIIYKIFDLAPSSIIYPLIGFTFLTPLNEFMRTEKIEPGFILYLLGETGSRKSTVAALFLSFFGDFNNKDLPSSFKDTVNSLEKQGALLKDVVTVIDDFHPSVSSKESSMMNDVARQLTRMYGDRNGKARMNSDCTLKKCYIPHGNAMETGEDLPNLPPSGLPRLFIVELNKVSLNNDVLSYIQENKMHLTYFMRKYIQWLIPKIDSIGATLKKEFISLRDSLNRNGDSKHGRIPEAISHLQIGVNRFCKFITESSGETNDKVKEMKENSSDVFKELAKNQLEMIKSSDPTDMFIEGIRTALDSAEWRKVSYETDKYSEIKEIDGSIVGYFDDKYYYLISQKAYDKVSESFKNRGERFPVSKNILLKMLKKKNYIDPMNEHENTCPLDVNEKKIRVVKFFRTYIDN